MNAITVPAEMVASFRVSGETKICDEKGRVLGFYKPMEEISDELMEWVAEKMTPEFIEAAEKSGTGRPLSELIAELRGKYGP